ncbi:ABC transporter substrate-binding protein [Allokutzneria sp. A3M-2-11 16]|uniref:ABC transporter substrate-binding protein n=1 Tax=Allokutzneria sp. A3M-2-11 16 TaxID=2962043 RepID=UPI0020B7CAAA|nr:ABC transporter substrate-binding protein [Allokutzneria sp. A3M-2-11 16]MCP3800628.1 ABC transporter substrate-binding protein [Allokutzneria sp. A3M-2-11 16]
MPRVPLRLISALALTAVLTACSGAATPQAGDTGGTAPAVDGVFPVRVEHKYGVTEVKAPPQRVVTLGLSDQDVALAVGVKPVGVVDWFKERPFGKWPWTQPLWGGTAPEIVGERDEYNLEKIARLRPDLIIAQYSGMKREQYDTLSQLGVPVVAQSAKFADYAAPWQEMTRNLTRALGKGATGEKLITDISDRFAKVRKENPAFAGRTAIVSDTFEPGNYAAFAAHDPKAAFLVESGFKMPQKLLDVPKSENIISLGSEAWTCSTWTCSSGCPRTRSPRSGSATNRCTAS